MFFWLLLGCSTIASLAMQPAVPRAIWQESRFTTALIGIWYDRLFLSRISGNLHILQIINLKDGCIEQELPLTSRPIQWATDSKKQNLVMLLNNNNIVIVNIFRRIVECARVPSVPVLAVNFLHDEPIMYVNNECEHCKFMWVNGHPFKPRTRYYVGKPRVAKHIITKECEYIIDISDGACAITNSSNGSCNSFPLNQKYNFSCNPTGSHCVVWDEFMTIGLLNLTDGVINFDNSIKITALCWSNNSKNFFTACGRRIYSRDIENVGVVGNLIAEQSPDIIIDLVVSPDEKTIVGLTGSNQCVLWKIENEQYEEGVFSSTIQVLQSLYTTWKKR